MMWRLANCVYRVFRNAATHCYSQDVLIPITTVCCSDDDANRKRNEKCSTENTIDINKILKNNQYTLKCIQKLEEFSKKFALQQAIQTINYVKPIEPVKAQTTVEEVQSISPASKPEEKINSIDAIHEAYIQNLNDLANLHEETMSIIDVQMAVDALESGKLQLGIETLERIAKKGMNAAASYNLGICYERGIGVEPDRAKACDYYRQAASLGHTSAQFNLTMLSNHIDTDENENEIETREQSINEKPIQSLNKSFFRFSWSTNYKEDDHLNDDQFDFKSLTLACLS